jgi:hypothetical protein
MATWFHITFVFHTIQETHAKTVEHANLIITIRVQCVVIAFTSKDKNSIFKF